MKVKKFLKNKKMPAILASGVLIAGLAGGAYYFADKQDFKLDDNITNSDAGTTTTDSQVQQNVEQKGEAAAGETTTTPAVVAESPVQAVLTDVSLTVLRDTDMVQAYVSLYGPAGTYGVEKLVNGSWTTLIDKFDYSGRGGRTIDTIASTASETHYRIFSLANGVRTATSGDTVITWQEILDNGTLTVPLAR